MLHLFGKCLHPNLVYLCINVSSLPMDFFSFSTFCLFGIADVIKLFIHPSGDFLIVLHTIVAYSSRGWCSSSCFLAASLCFHANHLRVHHCVQTEVLFAKHNLAQLFLTLSRAEVVGSTIDQLRSTDWLTDHCTCNARSLNHRVWHECLPPPHLLLPTEDEWINTL